MRACMRTCTYVREYIQTLTRTDTYRHTDTRTHAYSHACAYVHHGEQMAMCADVAADEARSAELREMLSLALGR